jgi:hypothetical protein
MGVAIGVVACLSCGSSEPAAPSGPSAGSAGAGAGGTAGAPGLGGSAGATVDASAPAGTQCEIPAVPAIAGETRVVGTGAPASCSQAALQAALAAAGKLEFDCGDAETVISVTETLVIKDGTHLNGKGKVTLDGGDAIRILRTESTSTVVLEGVSFRRGRAVAGAPGDSADGSGGAIYRGWQGTLFVKDCRFTGNFATGEKGFAGGAIFAASAGNLTVTGSVFQQNRSAFGGAIHTILSDLTVVDSLFEGNEATAGDGGAVFTDGGIVPKGGTLGAHDGRISLCGTRFVQNVATASAGAGFLYAYRDEASGKADRLEVSRCEFRGNKVTTADPGLGGALRIDAVATVSQCLFADNDCAGQGGALWMGRGPATFENTTFFGNHAEKWGGAISYGDKPITLLNCTLARNTAGEGSDCLFGSAGAATARNSLFFDNGAQGDRRNCNQALLGERNMAFPATDNDVCGGAAEHVDPKLDAALADHGGFTHTLALQPGPALDQGTACPAVDQRGQPREPNQCDLGAYER